MASCDRILANSSHINCTYSCSSAIKGSLPIREASWLPQKAGLFSSINLRMILSVCRGLRLVANIIARATSISGSSARAESRLTVHCCPLDQLTVVIGSKSPGTQALAIVLIARLPVQIRS